MKIVGIHLEPGGVGWHRCWNWTSALERMGHEVRHRPHAPQQFDVATLDNYLRGAEVVITSKMVNAEVFARLMAGRHLYRYKLVVDTDDDADAVQAMNLAYKDYHPGAGVVRIMRAQYREADLVTASTKHLADVVSKYNPNVVYVPNVVDPRLHGAVVAREKEARHRGDIRIYWGGGAGHYEDLETIKDALIRIVQEDERVKLVFSNFVPAWAANLPAFRAFMIPFAHLNAYARVLKWICADIAIAPLCDNPFNKAKSHVKYLDYAMAGIPGVYQDMEPYETVADGVTGLKARTQNDWYESIKALIEDEGLRGSIAADAKRDVLENWTTDKWERRYEQMLKELIARRSIPEVQMLTEGVPVEAKCLMP